MAARLRVTLRKSPISYTAKARGSVRALGLHRIGQTVELPDNPAVRGMARAVRFLVEVEEVPEEAAAARAGKPAASAAAGPGEPEAAAEETA
jgi:large subunit ribosomal protein L30